MPYVRPKKKKQKDTSLVNTREMLKCTRVRPKKFKWKQNIYNGNVELEYKGNEKFSLEFMAKTA